MSCGQLTVQQSNIALIQELWILKGMVRALGHGHMLVFYCTSVERSRACDYAADIDTTLLLALCRMSVVAILLKCRVIAAGRTVVACSAYLPCVSAEHHYLET
jgi:hypothetical protein